MTGRFQLLPRLSDQEYRDLYEDIEANGVEVPVLVSETGEIVDGHHRAEIAAKLAVPLPTQTLSGYTDAELRDKAIRLNVHRRQLTREQRDELIHRLRSDGMTQAGIAESVGMTDRGVAAVLNRNSSVEGPATIVNARGQQRPASYERQPTEDPDPALDEIEPDPAVTEFLGSSQALADSEYVATFARIVAKSDDFMEFNPERIGQLARPELFYVLEDLPGRVELWVKRAKTARSGLRVVGAGE
jgi:ParB-like chromosome segregation protein Spo0J